MKRVYAAIAAAVFIVGCGDSTGVEVDDLEGTWIATSYVFTNIANTSQTVDVISQGGSYTLTIRSDSSFTASFVEPGESMETRVGNVIVTGTVLTIAESGQGSPTDFSAVRNGDQMTLTTTDEDYDFDDDDVDDAATLMVELARQ